MSFDVPKEFGVPDEIGEMTRSLEMVPSDSGIFRSTGELREYGEKYWALLGHTGKREGLPRAGRPPPPMA